MVKHNMRYYEYEDKIKAVYVKILKEQKRMPSQVEVAKICSVSEATVRLHLHAIDLTQLVEPFKLMGSDVLSGLAEKAISGDAASARLFFFLVFDKVERKEIMADIKADVKAKVVTTVKIPDAVAKRIAEEMVKEQKG